MFLEEKIPFQEIERELAPITAKEITIPVVSPGHLKKLKKAAGRPQDLADIEALEALERTNEEER